MKPRTTLLQWAVMVIACLSVNFSYANIDEDCDDGADLFSIYCPADVTVNCTDELWDLSIYGNATYHGYNGWHSAGNSVDHWNLSSCNTGTITRTWSVEDYNWNIHSCSQTITVVGGSYGFGYDDITWPLSHIELEGCNPNTHPSQMPDGYGWPTYPWVDCTHIGVSYRDWEYIVDDGCRKIIRKWTVRDWCNSYGNSYGYGNNGIWTYDQVIKIIGGEEPTVSCQDTVRVSSYNCVDAQVNVPPLYVDGENCGDNYTVINLSPYADSNGADISGTYPIGKTVVKYIVKYGCNNSKICKTVVIVEDKKGPNVYCRGEIITALMPVDEDGDGIPEDGMIEIWAKDLDAGSTPNCNGYSVQFSFSEDVTDKVKTFTCAELGTNIVRLYVTDNWGRQSYCLVNVIIQNNGANIPDCVRTVDDDDVDDEEDDNDNDDDGDSTYIYIGGLVSDLFDSGMQGAKITATNMEPVLVLDSIYTYEITETIDTFFSGSGAMLWWSVFDTVTTLTIDSVEQYNSVQTVSGAEGGYIFEDLSQGEDVFEVSATYIPETADGGKLIDEADLNFLLQYLLGNKEMENVGQMFAADINHDKEINFDDLKILLEFISDGENDVLAMDYVVIPSPLKDLDMGEAFMKDDMNVNLELADADLLDVDFIAIKVGDIVEPASGTIITIPTNDIAAVMASTNTLKESELEVELREMTRAVVGQSVSVSPNPFFDNLLIQYDDTEAGSVTLQVLDISGKLLISNTMSTLQGVNAFEVDLSSKVQSGLLIYKVIDGENIISGKVLRVK